jgi:hypothetical protein
MLMSHRLALTSGFVLTTVMANPSSALAASVDIQFSGTVPEEASVSTVVNISEETVSSSYTKTHKTGNSSIPLKFSVESNIPTSVTVSYSNSSQIESEDFSKYSSKKVLTNFADEDANLPAGTNNIQLDLLLQRLDGFSPAVNNNDVTLTITAL